MYKTRFVTSTSVNRDSQIDFMNPQINPFIDSLNPYPYLLSVGLLDYNSVVDMISSQDSSMWSLCQTTRIVYHDSYIFYIFVPFFLERKSTF